MSKVSQGAGIKRYAPGILGVFDSVRQAGSSTNRAVYVQPAEPGYHFVVMPCNAQPIKIPSILGATTFQPGSVVLTGNYGGYTGEVLLGFPPASNSGGSLFAATSTVFEVAHSVPSPSSVPSCPTLITGRSYLAVEIVGDSLRLALYRDAERLSTLGDVFGPFSISSPQRNSSDVLVFTELDVNAIVTYNHAGSTGIATVAWADRIGPAVLSGAFIYFIPYSSSGPTTTVQLYRVPVGFDGPVSATLHKFGASYHLDGIDLATGIYCTGSSSFLLPCSLLGSSRMLSFYSGSWRLLPETYTVIEPESDHIGFQSVPGLAVKLGGNGFIRATPESEVEMMQVSTPWLLSSSGATVALYTSIDRSDVVVYPIDVSDGHRFLMRIPVHPVSGDCEQPLIDMGLPGTAPLFMIPRD